jgi:hypothetical protein
MRSLISVIVGSSLGLLACSSGDGDSTGPHGDASARGDDAGADAGPGADAGDAAAEPPLPTPDWDAAFPLDGPPSGYAYAEKAGSFTLVEPRALAPVYAFLAADTGDTRLFANHVIHDEQSAGLRVEYGSVFVEAGASGQLADSRYQYPDRVKDFRIAPSVGDTSTFVSQPFDYELYGWVPSANDPEVGYLLTLAARKATWVAHFTADYQSIDRGDLVAVLLRSEAEAAPLELDPLTCLAVCADKTVCAGGLDTLSSLLDCNAAELDVDADGDGTRDAYRLRIRFSSERVTPP